MESLHHRRAPMRGRDPRQSHRASDEAVGHRHNEKVIRAAIQAEPH
jgi:hypothetical protein